ncbi:MAG: cytochrome c [Proteobacteria bacterium]|nr:cytochrome c [Pseudomonadota bacterium]NOG59724.1 cytochrome c [Pseudomonadota bacterium]
MKRQKIILTSVLIAVGINSLYAGPNQDSPHLGHTISPEEIKKWDISVFPDGEGLPDGKGNVVEGEKLYQEKCIACHGENGLGASSDQLAGAQMGLSSEYPEQTIGSYWPYATTIFDVVRRSMPMTAPGSLTNNETYALTAYLLYLNNIISKDDVMNASTLAKVKMPNEDGFINVYEEEKSKK